MSKLSPLSESPEAIIQRRLLQIEAKRRGLSVPDPSLDRFRTNPSTLMTSPDPWQAELLHSQSRQIMLCCSRQSGKSTVTAALALKTALLDAPALILLLSPTLRQSGELFRDKVKRLYAELGKPVAIAQDSALTMELANGSRIISLPGTEETIVGYSGVKLLAIDEASLVEDSLYRSVRPMLAVSGGRLVALSTPRGKRGWFYNEWHGSGNWQRVRITAEECPRISVEFLAEERRSMGEDWYNQEYGCQFISGTDSPLFPSDWLVHSARAAAALTGKPRKAEAMGCDPGEGGANTAWAIVDHLGLIKLVSMKTPDTSVITSRTLALMREYGIPAEQVAFDRGGGGKQHVDRLREQGYNVRSIGFGEAVAPEPRRHPPRLGERIEQREDRYVYTNMRAAMYGCLRDLLDPSNGPGFGIPAEYAELRRQLAPMPLLWDREGRMRMLPKTKRDPSSTEQTLTDMLGSSPDESDALVLSCWAMLNKPKRITVGVMM